MKLELRNLTEDIVITKLDPMMERLGCCQCEICRLDIATYALNRLPAKYVATSQGKTLSKIGLIDNEFTARVTTELTKAIDIIKEHPNHDILSRETLPEFSDEIAEPGDDVLPPGSDSYFDPIDTIL